MPLDKYAAIALNKSRVNEVIVANLKQYSELQEAIQELIARPGESTANAVDEKFAQITNNLQIMKNVITTLANVIVNDEFDEIDGVEDENGIRLQ